MYLQDLNIPISAKQKYFCFCWMDVCLYGFFLFVWMKIDKITQKNMN